MKYPYIGKWEYINTTVIFTGESAGIEIGGEMSFRDDWTEINYKNITAEYLANTYGEVKSKEHAKFIKLLAETNDMPCAVLSIDMNYTMFYVIDGCLLFCVKEIDAVGDYKKITIPLPPESNVNTPDEDFEKNNGDNLIFGDTDKCKEWPCVGSKVTWGNKSVNGEVKAISDGLAWIKNDYDNYCTEYVSKLSKPKTPEEELRDQLFQCLNPKLDTLQASDLATWLIENYNITKKPQ